MKQVIILGGGISGMYAALKCTTLGYTVTLIEKKDRLGGNIHTVLQDNTLLETGAGRFNESHILLLDLIKYYGLNIYEHSSKKDFIPVLCDKNVKINTNEVLKKVLSYAKNVSDDLLKNITFSQLCEMVIGFQKTKQLIEAFGYNAEFLIENAYTAVLTFQRDFTNQYPYYSCKEGLSELVKRIEGDLLHRGVKILKETTIDQIKEKEGVFKLKAKTKEYTANYLIFALPKSALIQIPLFNDYTKSLLETVAPVSLHRIYAGYKKPWFQHMDKFTTDLQLRQFIPIDSKKGVAMVSYSDLFDADYWKTYADRGTDVLEENIKKHLENILPSISIPKAEWIQSYYWKEGVHVWLPNVDPIKIREELFKIHPRIFIVGESYSIRQGWIEGALETVEEMIPKLVKSGGGKAYKKFFKNKEMITMDQLKAFKISYPDVLWVLLQLPDETRTRLIDVTEWMYQHPGGAQPFINYKYTDISKHFKKIPYHFENNKLKENVFKNIKKYTLSYVE